MDARAGESEAVQTATFEIVDAIRGEINDLAPTDEQRFDPGTVGVMLALWLLQAVAEGVKDGIKEAAKDETKPVATAVISALKQRLPSYLQRPFQPGGGDQEAIRPRAREVEQDIREAREVFGQLSARRSGDLAGPIAAAVRESLQAQATGRLSEEKAQHIEQVVELQVRTLLEQTPAS
jgi:hypothetical protein